MFERLSNSWQLVRASAAVLKADRELLLFPVVSAVLSLLVVFTFAVPAFLSGAFTPGANGEVDIPAQGYLVVVLFYVVQYFVIFFCNTALVGAAMIRLRGGDPTVGDGFRIAVSRIRPILGYALIAATVGMVLRAISERSGVLGRLVIASVGLAWSLATYLVVPVLVVEDVGPIEAVRQSAAYLKQTWGEQIAGNIGMGLVFGLMGLAALAAGAFGMSMAVAAESTALGIAVVAVVALALVAISLVSSALNGVYAAAVYRYAAEGQTGTFFTPAMVKGTFRRK
jgi:Family of unknown function (DUF6159)